MRAIQNYSPSASAIKEEYDRGRSDERSAMERRMSLEQLQAHSNQEELDRCRRILGELRIYPGIPQEHIDIMRAVAASDVCYLPARLCGLAERLQHAADELPHADALMGSASGAGSDAPAAFDGSGAADGLAAAGDSGGVSPDERRPVHSDMRARAGGRGCVNGV